MHTVNFIVPNVYAVSSLLTFMFYAIDKSAAKKGRWRIKETTLHWLSLFGGWPGALLAQKILRHKNRKRSFQLVFWLTVLLNTAGLIGLWFYFNHGLPDVWFL